MTKSYYKNFLITHYPELTSTNSLAATLTKSYQIDHNHIILADSQTSGKGRMDRHWNSPIGNLYFSLILKPKKPISVACQLSFLAAVAMGLSISQFSKTKSDEGKINYKWPNDILIAGKKVAGILLESDVCKNSPENFIVLGIGININSHPSKAFFPSCNLSEQGFVVKDKIDLLRKFLDEFGDLYQKWLDFGFVPIRNLWLEKAFNLDKEIVVNLPTQTLKGVFKDLDNNGNLLLSFDDQEISITSGEVFIST